MPFRASLGCSGIVRLYTFPNPTSQTPESSGACQGSSRNNLEDSPLLPLLKEASRLPLPASIPLPLPELRGILDPESGRS